MNKKRKIEKNNTQTIRMEMWNIRTKLFIKKYVKM